MLLPLSLSVPKCFCHDLPVVLLLPFCICGTMRRNHDTLVGGLLFTLFILSNCTSLSKGTDASLLERIHELAEKFEASHNKASRIQSEIPLQQLHDPATEADLPSLDKENEVDGVRSLEHYQSHQAHTTEEKLKRLPELSEHSFEGLHPAVQKKNRRALENIISIIRLNQPYEVPQLEGHEYVYLGAPTSGKFHQRFVRVPGDVAARQARLDREAGIVQSASLPADVSLQKQLNIQGPLLMSGILVSSVTEILGARLGPRCDYKLFPFHPEEVVVNRGPVLIHLVKGGFWMRNYHPGFHGCTEPPTAIFLTSAQSNCNLNEIDVEYGECSSHEGRSSRAYVSWCRESPDGLRPISRNYVDGGNGLCAVFPGNWVPTISYLLEVDTVPVNEKRKFSLVTSVTSHHMSSFVRFELDAALERRKVSLTRFGSWKRTIAIPRFLKENNLPLLNETAQEWFSERTEKLSAIRWSKFHLAIDHKSVNGYISEKVWHALRVGTVPIYFGAPEARFLLPPRSTVYVEDYDTFDDLINHLLYLQDNDTAYDEYLEWKDNLKRPEDPYRNFLQGYGQGEYLNDHFCLWQFIAPRVLDYVTANKTPPPFRTAWTDWKTGQKCIIPPGACSGRKSILEPPTELICSEDNVDLSVSEEKMQSLYSRLGGRHKP